MSEWISLKNKLPNFSYRVLLLWEKTKHIEDGELYPSEHVLGEWYHVLFDGQSLDDPPSHWQPLPEPPK